MDHAVTQPHLTKFLRTKTLWSVGIGAFWVVFLWGFWERGSYALGMNAALYLAAASGLFLWTMARKDVRLKDEWKWLLPLALIVLSYALYENPFIKTISFVVFLAAFAFFVNHAFLADRAKHRWNDPLLTRLIVRCFSFFDGVPEALRLHGGLFVTSKDESGRTKRVAAGAVIFMAVALLVVIPLLSSADAEFGAAIDGAVKWISKYVDATLFSRICVAAVLSVTVLSSVVAWTRSHSIPERADAADEKRLDDIIAGMVIGGVLGLYLLFIGIQFKRLLVGSLPFDFKAVEQLVKSGFWQLLALTALNLLTYFITYRKTGKGVQKLLAAFTVASLLLLASAAQRMGLYVTYYGFSYEKFFASYTVLYCAVLLLWLTARMFMAKRADIAKFVVMLFVWMFAVATVFPVEQFVLRANVALAQKPDTQIRLFELSMLSPDVLGTVRAMRADGRLNERAAKFTREVGEGADPQGISEGWDAWVKAQEIRLKDKQWFEHTLSSLLAR